MIHVVRVLVGMMMVLLLMFGSAGAQTSELTKNLYDLGKLKAFDSELKVKSGEMAPDFTLPSVSGEKITLSQYRQKRNHPGHYGKRHQQTTRYGSLPH